MLFLDRADVEALLDRDALVDALATAMVDLSSGRASMPPRIGALVAEEKALLGAMPAYLPSLDVLAAKLVTLFPKNAAPLATHHALVAVFDTRTGAPVALMDGAYLTAVRTAAGSALATRTLAPERVSVLAILGTGVQARSHARAVVRVRRFAEVRVAGRSPEKAEALAAELAGELGLPVRPMPDFEAALRGADVVCATTHPHEPVVRGEWLKDGAHVSSVGTAQTGREVDDAAFRRARIVVESREAAFAPLPTGCLDFVEAIRAGAVSPEEVAELGEVLSGARPGRASATEITIYKSVGVAVQDAAAAALVLRAARARGAGRELKL